MKFLTLEKIKQQLRLDDTCEAELLKDYGDAAEETVLDTIGQTYEELVAERTMSVVPYTFEILLKPLVKL